MCTFWTCRFLHTEYKLYLRSPLTMDHCAFKILKQNKAYLTLISCNSSFSSSISASFAACSSASSSSSLNSLDSIIVTSLVRPRPASSGRGEAVGVTSVNSPSESKFISYFQFKFSSDGPSMTVHKIPGRLTRLFRFNHLCCIYLRHRTFYLYFLLKWI